MFQTLLEYLKHPVTTMIEKSEQEDLKKGAIKLAIISAVMSLVGVITKARSIGSMYSKDGTFSGFYSSDKLAELKKEALKNADLFGSFFKSLAIFAVVIAIIAAILFIIAKIVKSDKTYQSTLSMTNNAYIVYASGLVLNLILSLIYAPLGWIVLFAASVYGFFALINAFKDTLSVENSDGVVIATTLVIVVVVVILALIAANKLNTALSSIGGLSTITSLLK